MLQLKDMIYTLTDEILPNRKIFGKEKGQNYLFIYVNK
jgi:hypothetical protein